MQDDELTPASLDALGHGLGAHSLVFPYALTLFEVGAMLGRAAHLIGCDLFVECPPALRPGRLGKRIDFVFGVRAIDLYKNRRWIPLAGIEVEGLNASHDSLREDVARLNTLANGDQILLAVVLYRSSEDGGLFWQLKNRKDDLRIKELLREANDVLRAAAGGPTSIAAYIDENLTRTWDERPAALPQWIATCRARMRILREQGHVAHVVAAQQPFVVGGAGSV